MEVKARYKAKNRKLKMIIKDMAARIGKIMTENEAFIKEIDRLKEEISHL